MAIVWTLLSAAILLQHSSNGNVLSKDPADKFCLVIGEDKIICKGQRADALSVTGVLKHLVPGVNLKQLEFRHGKTPFIGKGTFQELTTISQLTVNRMSVMKLDVDAFKGLMLLKLLDLSHNNLTYLPPKIFLNTSIKHLKLNDNPGLLVPTNAPLFVAPRLLWLSLRHCSIQNLADTSFSETPLLSHLDLSSNRLEELPHVVFQNTSLTFLDLSKNDFKTISITPFHYVPGFPRLPQVVILTDNKWHCDCSMEAFVAWVSKDVNTHYPTTDPSRSRLKVETKCTSPPNLASHSWNKLEEWKCDV